PQNGGERITRERESPHETDRQRKSNDRRAGKGRQAAPRRRPWRGEDAAIHLNASPYVRYTTAIPAGTPTMAPPSAPYVQCPAAQPTSEPIAIVAAVVESSNPPAPAGLNLGRGDGSIAPEHTSLVIRV